MKLGLLVSFSRRLPLELGTFSKIPTAHTRYFQGAVIPPRGISMQKFCLLCAAKNRGYRVNILSKTWTRVYHD